MRFEPTAKELFYDSFNWMDRLEKEGIQRTESKQKTYKPQDGNSGIETDPDESKPRRQPKDESSGIEE